jgi:hypothetical protein
MRSFASSLVLISALTLQAQPKISPPEPRALENLKQFAVAGFDNLSCNQVDPQGNTKTITIEFLDPSSPRHGIASSLETGTLFKDVFAISSNTDFEFDHWAMLRGKKVVVYRYSNQINGKTHAGLVYADESSGAVSRITFRAADITAHLFCTAQ